MSKAREKTYADQAVLGLKGQGLLHVVVDEGKASGLGTTEDGLEAKDKDGVDIVDLEHAGQLLLQLRLGDVGTARVEHVNDLTTQTRFNSRDEYDELAT